MLPLLSQKNSQKTPKSIMKPNTTNHAASLPLYIYISTATLTRNVIYYRCHLLFFTVRKCNINVVHVGVVFHHVVYDCMHCKLTCCVYIVLVFNAKIPSLQSTPHSEVRPQHFPLHLSVPLIRSTIKLFDSYVYVREVVAMSTNDCV